MLSDIYNGDFISADVSGKCLDLLLDSRSRDRIPRYLPKNIQIAHKTGLEKGVCHDVGIVFAPEGDLLVCVLTKHSNPNSVPSKKFIARLSLLAYECNLEKTLDTEEGSSGSENAPVLAGSNKLSAKEIQLFMRSKGLYTGRIDGIIGDATRLAIKEFQKLSGLRSDGIVGEKTSAVIREDIRQSRVLYETQAK